MPTLASMRIPPPTDWKEFELITQSALKIKWSSPNLQRNGRQGQPQAGVDVFGSDDLGRQTGVQCKNTETELNIKLISAELEKAELFEPKLDTYYVATTAPNDAELQRVIRHLSKDRIVAGKFPVGILFWEDLIQELIKNTAEFQKHYPQISLNTNDQRISQPQMLCNLDIAYYGLQFGAYANLIFGEVGALANEDPLQIRALAEIVMNCSAVLFIENKAQRVTNIVNEIVSLALQPCESKAQNDRRWAGVDKNITLLTQDIRTLQYSLTGKTLAAYRLGSLLGTWNTNAQSPQNRINETDKKEITDLVRVLGGDDTSIAEIDRQITAYNSETSIETVNIPHQVYLCARKVIVSREVET